MNEATGLEVDVNHQYSVALTGMKGGWDGIFVTEFGLMEDQNGWSIEWGGDDVDYQTLTDLVEVWPMDIAYASQPMVDPSKVMHYIVGGQHELFDEGEQHRHPIVVLRPDGELQVCDGHHRVCAAILASRMVTVHLLDHLTAGHFYPIMEEYHG